MKTVRYLLTLLAAVCLPLTAAESTPGLADIQSAWARINYADVDSDKKADEFKSLIKACGNKMIKVEEYFTASSFLQVFHHPKHFPAQPISI